MKNDKKITIVKKRYIVLTDVYFLLFDPIIEHKHLANLLLVKDMQDLNACDDSELIDNKIIFRWNGKKGEIVFKS